MAELGDATGLGPVVRKDVWVQVPPPPQIMGLNLVKKTYNHHYGEHTTIILKEMCSRVGADYNRLPLEDRESHWYDLFTWTKEQEEEYKLWLIDYLYNNAKARKEVMAYSSKTKAHCRKCAETFLSWYGWKKAHMAELGDADASKASVRKDV